MCTFIASPWVRVPVLEVTMSVRVPAFSNAPRFLISKFYSISLSVDKAVAMAIARGRPSGMQAMRMATLTMTQRRSPCRASFEKNRLSFYTIIRKSQ